MLYAEVKGGRNSAIRIAARAFQRGGIPLIQLSRRVCKAWLALAAWAALLCQPLLATTPVHCGVENSENNQIRVYIPEQLRSTGSWRWSVDGVPVPGSSYKVTFEWDPFQGGEFRVVARNPARVAVCTIVLQVQPAEVQRVAFVDPYPKIDEAERQRFIELRRVARQEDVVAEAASKANIASYENDKILREIDDITSDRDGKISEIKDVDSRQKLLIDAFREVLDKVRQSDDEEGLRTHPAACRVRGGS